MPVHFRFQDFFHGQVGKEYLEVFAQVFFQRFRSADAVVAFPGHKNSGYRVLSQYVIDFSAHSGVHLHPAYDVLPRISHLRAAPHDIITDQTRTVQFLQDSVHVAAGRHHETYPCIACPADRLYGPRRKLVVVP